MRKAYLRHPVLFVGVLVSLVSGAVAMLLRQSPADAFLITLVTTVLAIEIEMLLDVGPLKQCEFMSLDQIAMVREDKLLADSVSALLGAFAAARAVKNNAIFQQRFERVVRTQASQFQRYARGVFRSSFTPEHFFREPDMVWAHSDIAVCTSMVDPEYWSEQWAREYLKVQSESQARVRRRKGELHVAVERIFIEKKKEVHRLLPVLRLHQEFGIRALVAVFEEVPAELRGDYMVVDDEMLWWLEFASGTRTPIASSVVIKGMASGEKIVEYRALYASLRDIYAHEPTYYPELQELAQPSPPALS